MAILAAPIAVVALAAIAILLLLFRLWKSGLVVLVLSLGLNWWTEQIPLRFSHREVPAVKPAGTLRVLSYNVCGKVSYVPQHGQPFIDYVKNVDADILFLPENCLGTCFAFEDMLKAEYPYSLHNFPEFEAEKTKNYPDQTLYSRYPLSGYKRYRLDKEAMRERHPFMDSLAVERHGAALMVFEVTADVEGTPVTLLHVHLRTNGFDGAKDSAEGRRSLVHNVYDALMFGYAYRSEEVAVIRDSLAHCPNPLLVCGDFNDFNGSRSVTTVQNSRNHNVHRDHRDRLQDAWWKGGSGMGFTFDDQHLLLRIDHILYSKEFDLQAVSVPQVPYSDHLPLIADFIFEK